MRRLKSRIISILLVAFLIVGLFPAVGLRVRAESGFTEFYVGETEVTPETTKGEGWSFDYETNTLTLNGFCYEGEGKIREIEEAGKVLCQFGIYYGGTEALKVNLVDYNSIWLDEMDNKEVVCCSAFYSTASLIFEGEGKLFIYNPDSSKDHPITENNAIFSHKDIVINGCEITAMAGDSTHESVGIAALETFTVNSGIVEAAGYEGEHSYGIYAWTGLKVQDGVVNGISDSVDGIKKRSGGIFVYEGEVVIEGGKVNGSSAILQEGTESESLGVSGESIIVNGGFLTGKGGEAVSENQISAGFQCTYESVKIGENSSAIACGYTQAVALEGSSTFTNERSGLGWSDYDGVEGETEIPINSDYELISNFKKVRFADPDIVLEAEGFDGIYDGKEHTINLSVKTPKTGYTIKYGLRRGKYDLDKAPSFKDAGYELIFYIVQAEGYSDYEGYVNIIIAKAPQTITADSLNLKVGQSAKINAKSSAGGKLSYVLKAGKAITLDKKTGKVTAVKEGTAYVLVTAASTDNYKTGIKVVKVKVTAADPPAPVVKTVDMLRLYNPNSGEHFYTASTVEKDNLIKAGWKYEGLAWKAPEKSKTPVYRLYNANAGDHHYTVSNNEKENLIKAGWKYEGIGWYSDDSKTVPLYRLYNPNAVAGSHHYTMSKKESTDLIKAGWKDEGIAWYGK